MKFDCTSAHVQTVCESIEHKNLALRAEIVNLDEQIRALQKKRGELESAERGWQNCLHHLVDAMIVMDAMPEEVTALLHEWRSLLKEAARDDITVKAAKCRSDEAAETLMRLQAACAHALVVEEDGTRGDADGPGSPDIRTCVVCGLQERQWDYDGKRKDYAVFNSSERAFVVVRPWLGSSSKRTSFREYLKNALTAEDPRDVLFPDNVEIGTSLRARLRENLEKASSIKTPA